MCVRLYVHVVHTYVCTERPKSKVPEENGNWLEILIIFGKQTAENVNKLF